MLTVLRLCVVGMRITPGRDTPPADSDPDDGTLGFDRLDLMQGAFPSSGTSLAGRLPRLWRPQVRIPEGPRAALSGASLIDFAFARFVVEEDAIPILQLDEALADPHQADIPLLEFRNRELGFGGHLGDVRPVEPDVAWGPGTAVATTGALETQALGIPGKFLLSWLTLSHSLPLMVGATCNT